MLNDLWENHRGKLLGTGVGFFLGLLYLIVGFWDMLIFAFILFIGYYMGKKLDRGEKPVQLDHLWQWLSERWKMFR
ncbi:MAG: hypothetical protein K0R57_922 [Paenibacillaceae bacterium]|jgi:uncharacterized membrane protein|nr:hypothetical protein [Paenibacillaceae bacterium]